MEVEKDEGGKEEKEKKVRKERETEREKEEETSLEREEKALPKSTNISTHMKRRLGPVRNE